jgi:hypothetical protein
MSKQSRQEGEGGHEPGTNDPDRQESVFVP